ncbi:Protein RETICULATA-RELATED 6 chloroplastic, partial [Dissostichus eleginoides]
EDVLSPAPDSSRVTHGPMSKFFYNSLPHSSTDDIEGISHHRAHQRGSERDLLKSIDILSEHRGTSDRHLRGTQRWASLARSVSVSLCSSFPASLSNLPVEDPVRISVRHQ